MSLKGVMIVQAIVLALYGLPYLLVPANAQVFTGRAPVPETYFLRVIGITFVVLAWLEFQIVTDLSRHRELTLTSAIIPTGFFITIALQLVTTGFNEAVWYWWLNLVITGAFAIAMFTARKGPA